MLQYINDKYIIQVLNAKVFLIFFYVTYNTEYNKYIIEI